MTGPTKVALASYVEEVAHAKNVGDGLASEIKNKVNEFLRSHFGVQPGTRNHVLLLAELFPKPLRDAGNKTGVWSPDRIFYAFYSDEVLKVEANADFKAYPNSKKYHFRVGQNTLPARAHEGKLTVREGFCACSSCHAPRFDFRNCKFHVMMGRPVVALCPPLAVVKGAVTRSNDIRGFAMTLKAGENRAVDTAADQVVVEGAPFWLCVLVGDAFQVPEPGVVFAGEFFEKDFFVVKIKWYQFVRLDSAGQRCYRLLSDEHMLSVHTLVRCDVGKLAPVEERGRGRPVPLFCLTAKQCGLIAENALIQDFEMS